MKKYLCMMMVLASTIGLPFWSHAEDKAAPPAAEAEMGHKAISPEQYEKLSPEAKEVVKERRESMEKLSPALKEELKNYRDARKALYEKLSPEAKAALKERREKGKAISPAVRKELRDLYRAQEGVSSDKHDE